MPANNQNWACIAKEGYRVGTFARKVLAVVLLGQGRHACCPPRHSLRILFPLLLAVQHPSLRFMHSGLCRGVLSLHVQLFRFSAQARRLRNSAFHEPCLRFLINRRLFGASEATSEHRSYCSKNELHVKAAPLKRSWDCPHCLAVAELRLFHHRCHRHPGQGMEARSPSRRCCQPSALRRCGSFFSLDFLSNGY